MYNCGSKDGEHSSIWPDDRSQIADVTSKRLSRCIRVRPAGPLGSVDAVPIHSGADQSQSRAEAAAASWWRLQPRVDYTPFNQQRALELAEIKAQKQLVMKAKVLRA